MPAIHGAQATINRIREIISESIEQIEGELRQYAEQEAVLRQMQHDTGKMRITLLNILKSLDPPPGLGEDMVQFGSAPPTPYGLANTPPTVSSYGIRAGYQYPAEG